MQELEATVLAAIMYDNPEYIDQITIEDITTASYQQIFKSMQKLHEKQEPIDVITLGMDLQGKGLSGVLATLSGQAFKGANYENYIKKLKSATAKRKIQEGIQFIHEQLKLDDAAEIKGNILEYFTDIALPGQTQDDSIKTILLKTGDYLENKYKNRGDTSNHTGIGDLDTATGGLHGGEMTILAARPSVGKTAFAMQVATEFAKKGKVVQCFSQEMSQVQVATRMLSANAKVDGIKMRNGNLKEADWVAITTSMAELSNYKLFIDDQSSKVPDIRAVCREKKQKHGLDLIMIDYLQLLTSVKKTNNREQEVADISRQIKKMTIELNVPILVLSQLNRSGNNRRPTIDTLRESGSLEQDADNVIMLHKPDIDDVEEKEMFREIEKTGREYVEVILGKQRNGPTGIFNMQYNPRFIRFESIYRGRV